MVREAFDIVIDAVCYLLHNYHRLNDCNSLVTNIFSILTGMSELVKERPANPIEYLASYLLRHDPARVGSNGQPGKP